MSGGRIHQEWTSETFERRGYIRAPIKGMDGAYTYKCRYCGEYVPYLTDSFRWSCGNEECDTIRLMSWRD